ncbi:MAG TPA: quinone-dependent dihydroorotate dehydrogenase [Burkholderiales bacterium]|nr:quinone-dependent dihydroorotate dehydrogenase [Burkholderiales bacterium]
MSLYRLARPLLFSLDPETAHRAGLRLSALSPKRTFAAPVSVMGLEFPNPVGLAAGLDKDAAHIDALARLGFGFIEVGTVTPRPQPGNPRPRLFRIPEKQGIVNRFGFNNVGLDRFVTNLRAARWKGILGINIGKNADTPVEQAADDYAVGLERVYPDASYVTINISSPNTKGLRGLQDKEALDALLERLARVRERLAGLFGRRVPLVLQVAPDLDASQIESIAAAVVRHGLDGVIATNTSVSREGVEGLPHAAEAGGLSGAPIRGAATRVLKQLSSLLPDTTLVGAGGIASGADAAEKFAAGAALVQLYTGLIYRGPELVGECVSAYPAK